MTPLQQHQHDWQSCTRCSLCETRKKVVLMRGSARADVLFIGEAPGLSEDAIGLPFVGPAGRLLDTLIEQAASEAGYRPKIAWTNVISCVPDKTTDNHAPTKESIRACRPRLLEFIGICRPKIVVAVGKISLGQIPHLELKCKSIEITHPSAILQAESNSSLLKQRVVTRLRDAFWELV